MPKPSIRRRPPARRSLVLRNRHWARKLRLRPHLSRIKRKLGLPPKATANKFIEALRNFQQSQGIPASGVLNPQTWDTMQSAPPPPPEHTCQCPVCQSEPPAVEPEPEPEPQSEPQAAATEEEFWDWLSGWTGKPAQPAPAANVDRSSSAYARWVQAGLNKALGLKLAVDGIIGTKTRAAIRDFQTRQGLPATGTVDIATEQALIRNGAGNPPAATAPPSSSTGVNTPLPASGPGFYAKPESNPSRQYGLSATIANIQTIGRAWKAKHPTGPSFGITDISKQGGGTFPPHKSHQKGTDVDIRPLRTDGAQSPVSYKDKAYSRSLTQDLVNTILSSSTLPVTSIFFNDSAISGVKPLSGHDDHLHVTFGAPSTTSNETSTSKPDQPPPLLKSESDPPLSTIYAGIKLGSEAPLKPMTGIFFPIGYTPKPEVDIIVYFHGHRIEKKNVKESIDSYWNKSYAPYFPLREELNSAGKNVILVAPTLGLRSQPGYLLTKGGLSKYLDAVLQAIRAHGPHKGAPAAIRNIILCAHSGGGTAMRYCALYGGKYTANIRECWGFDCLYDSANNANWRAWSAQHPAGKAYFYWRDTRTKYQVDALSKNKPANITIAYSDKTHMYVPVRYFKERVLGFA